MAFALCAGAATAQEAPGADTQSPEAQASAPAVPPSSAALPAELAGALASAIEVSKRALTLVGSDSKQLDCWLQKLAAPGSDDRVIRWTSICTEGPVCAQLGVGADALKKLTSAEQVETVNASLGDRKLILHLKTDLVRKYLFEPQVNSAAPNLEVYADHLEAIAADVARAERELAAAGAPEHSALRGWIDARKKDPKSVYACAMDVVRGEDEERAGGDE